MNFGKENDIVYALNAPPSEDEKRRDVAALVAYLRSRKNFLDDELANLLDKNGDSLWELRLVRRDNRYAEDVKTVKHKVAAFQRVGELIGSKADRTFVDDIMKGLQAKQRGSSWKVEPRKASWLLQENGHTFANISAGKPLTEAAAKKIAAAEHGFSYGTFRDIYRDIERDSRAE